MYSMCMYNKKGGVGKTSMTGCLGAYLALKGYKVLMIDADPQGNLSTQFGKDFNTEFVDFLKNEYYQDNVGELLYPTDYDNLYICPTKSFNTDAGLESWITTESTKENQDLFDYFLEQIGKVNVASENQEAQYFDYVIFDLHPSDSEMKQKIILASDEVIPVLQVAKSSLDGFAGFYKSYKELIKKRYTKFNKIIFTMLDKRTTVTKILLPMIEELAFDKYMIPKDEAFRKAETAACSLFEFSLRQETVDEIEKLANTIINEK